MIQCEFSVLLDDGTLSVEGQDLDVGESVSKATDIKFHDNLQGTREGIHENREEKDSTTTEEAIRIRRHVVENRS